MSTFRVHYFQHIIGEGLGSPESWLQRHHAVVSATEFFALAKGEGNVSLPNPDDIDLLIIMGGEMSAYDEDIHPWLIAEKQWIRHFIELGKPVIGLCLGGQLIASCLGATVKKNHVKEIGWWPVQGRKVNHSTHNIFPFPNSLTALSWHGDTFELPDGAIWLAESEACAHQAFQYGARVLGFQFHPEITPKNLTMFLSDYGYDSMIAGNQNLTYIQTPAQMADVSELAFQPANQLLETALDFVTRTL
ncbi:MAG: type 1 glutamine amidotransferase [Aquirhabdus sp.]